MATNQPMNPKFTWGDCVQIVDNAPPQYRSGAFGSICGLDERAAQVVYIVEYGDGSSCEIPEEYITAGRREASQGTETSG